MLKLNRLKIVGLIGVLAIALSACSAYQKQSATGGQNPAQNQTAAGSGAADEANAVVIMYSDSGFTPASVNAKVGQKVIFKNTSSKAVQVNSDPHPVHTLYPELNIGMINAGGSMSLTFSTTGTKTYHNHLSPSEKGSIVVQ